MGGSKHLAVCLTRKHAHVLFQSIVLATCLGISTWLSSGVLRIYGAAVPKQGESCWPQQVSGGAGHQSGCDVGTHGYEMLRFGSTGCLQIPSPVKKLANQIKTTCLLLRVNVFIHHLRVPLFCIPVMISIQDETSPTAGRSWKQYLLFESVMTFFFMPFLELGCFP